MSSTETSDLIYVPPHEMTAEDSMAMSRTGYPPTRSPADEDRFRPGSPEQDEALRAAGWRPGARNGGWRIDPERADELAPEPEPDLSHQTLPDGEIYDPEKHGNRRKAIRDAKKRATAKAEPEIELIIKRQQARNEVGPGAKFMDDDEIDALIAAQDKE